MKYLLALLATCALGAERTQTFDSDPNWHGHNNRVSHKPRTIKQDFGFGLSTNCNPNPGEIGGFMHPAAEPSYYGKKIAPKTFNDALSASGVIRAKDRNFNMLIGFFNNETINEWRTPNTIAFRFYGRGDVFIAYAEYATKKWRAGMLQFEKEFPSAPVHQWSLVYSPTANNGTGQIIASVGSQSVRVNLDPGHKEDGATFNRFGILNIHKSFDTGGEVWFDDLTINEEKQALNADPQWEGFHNRTNFMTRQIRGWFDFGFCESHFAGGKKPGELGGITYRGDGRKKELLAFYGDRLKDLTLAGPLKARGKVSLRRGVSDSDTLIGFFHAEHSLDSGGTDRLSTPPDFLGVRIGGPSAHGFFFSPIYRVHTSEYAAQEKGPVIMPDGAVHDWTLEFTPEGEGARVAVTLDGQREEFSMPAEHRRIGAHFNRFGIITTHHDGNGQKIYFDDLTYTYSQTE